MVKAEDLTRNCILNAMSRGDYYSTMGPSIYDWGRDDNEIYLECSPVSEVHFITYPARGKSFFGDNIASLRYSLKGGEYYVRIEIIDDKGRRAWTNPLYL